ncbi:hypothetical protein [Rhizobium sp. P44RR-XXIV]|uniref:hypothetical protein n=1 Tax=Rhizobium sp. P44RR-XXIV TaxID=1921145 RepID=UPI000987009C|nr:hypothetical protein [Rhizobium sp. P44RR-XXIV]TIX88770.1 hypothetical protein BSK43_019090 [Rhizobium sp. P44RR-XXIV]
MLALVDRLFQAQATWPELTKQIRAQSGVDLFTAQKIALSHQGWRRLCNQRINRDSDCRKQAIGHIKHYGPNSLITLSINETLAIDEPPAD